MKESIVIVGAGIAGLSAAWELARAGRTGVVVIEAAARSGGVMASEARDGFLIEQGPDSWLSRKTAAAELCREVGLGGDLIGTLPQPGGARILHGGRLHPLPAGWRMIEPTRLLPVLRSPLFSWGTKARLAIHWRRSPTAGGREESVGAYLRRRFGADAGQAIADTIAAPMLGGVYGGDAEALSLAAVMPPAPDPAPVPVASAGTPAMMFTSLRGGMGSLAAALAEGIAARLPAGALRLNCPVRSIVAVPAGGYHLALADGTILEAKAVILATPAGSAAAMLAGMDPALAALLDAIPYASSVNVNLGYTAAPPLPPGFGFLAPRAAGHRLLACTFAHQKFHHRAPAGGALVRLFYADEAVAWNDARIEETAHRELRELLGVSVPPAFVRICRWPRAMPQYTVGFAVRAAAIAAAVARHPGLRLAGNAYGGIGVPDCIANGRRAARQQPAISNKQ